MRTKKNKIEPLIKSVIPQEGKRIRIILGTGSELILNMENRLNTVRFCPLQDESVFYSVKTDGFYIRFDVESNYALDFTLHEAIKMCISSPSHPYYQLAEEGAGKERSAK